MHEPSCTSPQHACPGYLATISNDYQAHRPPATTYVSYERAPAIAPLALAASFPYPSPAQHWCIAGNLDEGSKKRGGARSTRKPWAEAEDVQLIASQPVLYTAVAHRAWIARTASPGGSHTLQARDRSGLHLSEKRRA